jgi:hypothetical protein
MFFGNYHVLRFAGNHSAPYNFHLRRLFRQCRYNNPDRIPAQVSLLPPAFPSDNKSVTANMIHRLRDYGRYIYHYLHLLKRSNI